MKIALIDDQRECLEIIKDNLISFTDDLYSFTSINEMEKTQLTFDLLLLDIDMPDYDGIQYAQDHLEYKIIFVTSQYLRMKEAFGSNVYGFIEKGDSPKRYRELVMSVCQTILNEKTITLKSLGELYCFKQGDVSYLLYEGYKTISLYYQGKLYLLKGYTLSECFEMLESHFYYISRDVVVNLYH